MDDKIDRDKWVLRNSYGEPLPRTFDSHKRPPSRSELERLQPWTKVGALHRIHQVWGAAERCGMTDLGFEIRTVGVGAVAACLYSGQDVVWATAHDGDPLSRFVHDGETFIGNDAEAICAAVGAR